MFKEQHDPGHGDIKIMFTDKINTTSVGKGANLPKTQIPGALLESVNYLLEELGYQGMEPDSTRSCRTKREATQSKVRSRLKEIFDGHFPKVIQRKRSEFRSLNGTCKFSVYGNGGGSWLVDLTTAEAQVRSEEGPADCTISLSADVLIDVIDGRRNPVEAFQCGDIGVNGNRILAATFGTMLLR
ncbi:MAG: SCP2 sterol-binding domain-containing protein [Gammaproteobacteria bacterium]